MREFSEEQLKSSPEINWAIIRSRADKEYAVARDRERRERFRDVVSQLDTFVLDRWGKRFLLPLLREGDARIMIAADAAIGFPVMVRSLYYIDGDGAKRESFDGETPVVEKLTTHQLVEAALANGHTAASLIDNIGSQWQCIHKTSASHLIESIGSELNPSLLLRAIDELKVVRARIDEELGESGRRD